MKPRENVALSAYTTLGVGGSARFFLEAVSEPDVEEAASFASTQALPLFVLGGGSNLVVADEGFPGVVLKVSIPGVSIVGPEDLSIGRVSIRAGAGEDWDRLVALAVQRNLAGIECLSGIPGTVGGTPVQNVGAYGQEVSEVIRTVRAWDRNGGRIVDLKNAECGFAYRTSRFNTTDRDLFIILSVDYELVPGGQPHIEYRDLAQHFAGRKELPSLSEVRDQVREIRRGKAMLLVPGDPDGRSAGSFFKNPVVDEARCREIEARAGAVVPRFPAPNGQVKVPAAWLIEQTGFRKGHRRGGAAISSKHTLALVNRDNATAGDIIDLAREIRDRVRERFGIELRPEPVFLGLREEF